METVVGAKETAAHFRASINGTEIAVLELTEFPKRPDGTVLDGAELIQELRVSFAGHVSKLSEVAGEYETRRETWRPEYKAVAFVAAVLKQKYRQGVESGDVRDKESLTLWLARRISIEFVL